MKVLCMWEIFVRIIKRKGRKIFFYFCNGVVGIFLGMGLIDKLWDLELVFIYFFFVKYFVCRVFVKWFFIDFVYCFD